MSEGGEDRGRDGASGDDVSGGNGPAASADAVSHAGNAPGLPATRRNRLRSAALWGAVGGFAFLAAAQGYLLVGGTVPFGYAWLFGMAAVVAAAAGALAYLTEHRIARRGGKRRT
ncbi:hypothetical protein ACFPM1_12370 [Halorubrum rubrum]|uniref:DUF7981 domain-containing protein n=1 Tax=Halorubrum rubrum TaxID=1126240 RepID=A0ABD5R3W3_9EURY|nr:hypothetical protein [Halorubrum rubrum]